MSNCPSCGRPIEFDEKYSKVISCQYCNSVLEFGSGELSKVGEQNAFLDFPSAFEVGKTVNWRGASVKVQGQARYEYEGGFYDDFFVIIDQRKYVLRQDDGIIKKYKITQELQQEIDMKVYKVGENGLFGSKDIFVQETGLVNLFSIKGQSYTKTYPGKLYDYVDGVIDGHMVYIEKQRGGDAVRILLEQK